MNSPLTSEQLDDEGYGYPDIKDFRSLIVESVVGQDYELSNTPEVVEHINRLFNDYFRVEADEQAQRQAAGTQQKLLDQLLAAASEFEARYRLVQQNPYAASRVLDANAAPLSDRGNDDPDPINDQFQNLTGIRSMVELAAACTRGGARQPQKFSAGRAGSPHFTELVERLLRCAELSIAPDIKASPGASQTYYGIVADLLKCSGLERSIKTLRNLVPASR